jgi:RNA 2',3'-cyclic 3'-phosphodiesterase
MRAFIAIELPKEIKEHLSKIQGKLKASGADVKWVEPANIHLTLKFLGEIDEEVKAKVITALSGIASDRNSFIASISSIGAFPKAQSPRVIWAGLNLGDEQVKEIAKQIDSDLEKIGLAKEDREFSSHITLGRTKSSKNRIELVKLLEGLSETQLGPFEFHVSKITFFKSTLTPKGPIYEALHESCLGSAIS